MKKYGPAILAMLGGLLLVIPMGGGVAPVPPSPVEPIDPQPVVSFRAIFVKESGSTLTAAQTAIPGAKAIRDYLNANTTGDGNTTGWREYDMQQNVANEKPIMKALWLAVLPKIQTVPCIVIEVNSRATVLPYPANADDALATLKKYRGK